MEQQDFLAAVTPSQGKYCTFVKVRTPDNKDGYPKNIFHDSLDDFVETNFKQSLHFRNETFFAMSSFDDTGFRTQTHTIKAKSVYMDLDCGIDPKTGAQKAFPSKREAVQALMQFMQAIGLDTLGTPWLLDSGGGVHCHLALDNEITTDEWNVLANKLKDAANKHGFTLDKNVTGDSARVMRFPGTLNHKYDPPRTVTIKQVGSTFSVDAIRTLLQPYSAGALAVRKQEVMVLEGRRPMTLGETAVGKALLGGTDNSFKKIWDRTRTGKGCAQLEHYVAHATEDGMEPLWRAWLSVTKFCTDGRQAAVRLSSMHPYDTERMDRKLAAVNGPLTCAAFGDVGSSTACAKCAHKGRITGPIQLGRVVTEMSEVPPPPPPPADEVIYGEPDDEDKPFEIGKAPPGFFYASNGAVWYKARSEEEDDIMVLPYSMHLNDIFREEGGYKAEFEIRKPGQIGTFAVAMGSMSEAKTCVKALASANVFPAPGAGALLARFAAACVAERSHGGHEVMVPETMGWQENGMFVIGDEIIAPDGRVKKYKSERLDNLIHSCQPKGTVEGNLQVPKMLVAKAKAAPECWWLVAIVVDALASPLAIFSPAIAASSTMHVCGKNSGGGKSLVMYVGASFWGKPTSFILTSKTSSTTIMQRAGMLNGMPMMIDEVTRQQDQTGSEFIPTLSFDFADGRHKTKGLNTVNGEVSQKEGWRGYMQLSSNRPVLEYLAGVRKGTSEGEMQRLMECHLRDDWNLSWTPEEKAILAGNMEENYGQVGRAWVRFLMRNKDEVKRIRAYCLERWMAEVNPPDTERFWTERVVNNLTTAILLGMNEDNGPRAKLIHIPIQPLLEFWRSIVVKARNVIARGRRSALDILNEYLQLNSARMVISMPGSVVQGVFKESPSKGDVMGRIEHDNNGRAKHYIPDRTMKAFCASHNTSYESFTLELSATHTVGEQRLNLNKGTGGPVLTCKCLLIDMASNVIP